MTNRRTFIRQLSLGASLAPAAAVLAAAPAPQAPAENPPPAAALALPPYLQNPAPDAMSILWRTAEPADSWIEYGEDPAALTARRAVEHGIVVSNVTRHKVRLTGLKPGTAYTYRVCTRKILKFGAYKKEFGPVEKSDPCVFKTLGPSAKDFTCLVFTDLHSNLALFDKLMEQVARQGVRHDFSVFDGDIFNDPPSESEIHRQIARFNNGVDAASRPAVYLRGNHEVRGSFARDLPASFLDLTDGEVFFAFSFGDTRFVLLDNGEDKRDTNREYSGMIAFDDFRQRETAWLKRELAGAPFKAAARRILIHHIPIYGWKNNHDSGFIACRDEWAPIFQDAPFDLAVTGHLHRYKFHRARAAGNPFPLVVGGGPSEAEGTVMALEKRGGSLTLRTFSVSGEIDRQTITG